MEAEQSVLGALLLDIKAYARISDAVTAADFYRAEHRVIFGALEEMIAQAAEVDVITLYERLHGSGAEFGGLPYLNQLAACVPSAANIRRHAEIVAERSALRQIIAMADDVASRAFRGDASGDVLDDTKSTLVRLEQRRLNPGRRVPLMSLDELRQAAGQMRWLVKHVIPADSIGMLFGGSGTFKSFIAIDAALHVAHGLPWLGRYTAPGPVLYIAAEGGTGLWSRIDAWHRDRRLRMQDAGVYVVPTAVDLTVDAWRVVEAVQGVGVTPALVVVDTLSQTYGGEENSANEMAAYLRELGTRFRSLWGCAVLLVHHSGHQATERPRGSSAIRGNVDFLLGVHRDEKEMLATLTCVKQKDGDLFRDATFAMSKCQLGNDDDGDPLTSLVARHLSSADQVTQAMEDEAKAGRGGRNHLLLTLLQNGMREAELRKAFYEDVGLDDLESRKKAYQRAKAWAVKAGFIEVAAGVVITLKPAQQQ